MSEFPGFLMKIAKATNPPEERAGMMSIIVRRHYAYLDKELCSTLSAATLVGEDQRRSSWKYHFQPRPKVK